jgi:hypothetical protein
MWLIYVMYLGPYCIIICLLLWLLVDYSNFDVLWQVLYPMALTLYGCSGTFNKYKYDTRRRQIPRTSPRQRTYLAQTYLYKMGITLTKMYWLLGHKSKFFTSNKILIYKAILKPIWTYGLQLWGTTSTPNIEILEGFQSKALRIKRTHPGTYRTQ